MFSHILFWGHLDSSFICYLSSVGECSSSGHPYSAGITLPHCQYGLSEIQIESWGIRDHLLACSQHGYEVGKHPLLLHFQSPVKKDNAEFLW